jgi:hypothetical protein
MIDFASTENARRELESAIQDALDHAYRHECYDVAEELQGILQEMADRQKV